VREHDEHEQVDGAFVPDGIQLPIHGVEV
jgi:hypothetical protein